MLNSIITLEDFRTKLLALSVFPIGTKVAVGVSGGADSLCLIFLLQQIAKTLQLNICALIVDHKLRSESTIEAQFVVKLLNQHKIKSTILTRSEQPLTSKIQEIARKDRYQLLYDYCKNNDYSHLLVAHHEDDALETMLMRKQKGKNIVGSAGISAKVVQAEVILLRPLLNYTKEQLINTLKQYTQQWIEDPSNCNSKFTRVQIRQQINSMPTATKQAYRLQLQQEIAARKKIEKDLINLFANNLIISNLGVAKVHLASLLAQDINLQLMYLRKLMLLISASSYMAKIKKTYNLLNFLQGKQTKYTLGGCLFHKKQGYLYIVKELLQANISSTLQQKRWDNRFIINFKFKQHSQPSDYKITNLSLMEYQKLCQEADFKSFMQDNFVTFNELSNIPCIFYQNKQQSFFNKKYYGIELQFKQSLFMSKFYS